MKKLKLFPKTFLYTFFMLLFINLLLHLMIYFFYPKVYLERIDHQLESQLDELLLKISQSSDDAIGKLLQTFARQNQVNVTLQTSDGKKTYPGMRFDLSLYNDSDQVFSVENIDNTPSIIVKNRVVQNADNTKLKLQIMASAEPVQEANDIIAFLLPFTFVATILFSIIFSWFYSKRITNPIVTMLKVTTDMKDRKPDARFYIETMDEMGILAEQINEVYQCLLLTIQQLDEEKERMLELEKSKTVFLRSASHELKTPLAGLRILLENMEYNIGKYKDRDRYLKEAIDMVDQLTTMVKDILNTSKMQENTVNAPTENILVEEKLKELLLDYKLQIIEKHLTVTMDIAPEFIISMRNDTFKQVWSNLISNAVSYTDINGFIRIGSHKNKLWIENSCTPLAKEQLTYIFEPFYRTDATRNTPTGNGLGLYVVTEALKKEKLSYEFVPVEHGMCFSIFLPEKHTKKAD